MQLIKNETQLEISHLYYLVSAYENSHAMFEELRTRIREALIKAKQTSETQIVNMDSSRFCFHVHPSGSISLMVQMDYFDRVEEE